MTDEDRAEYRRQMASWSKIAEARGQYITGAKWRDGHLTVDLAPKSSRVHDPEPEPRSPRGVGQGRLL